MILKNGRIIDPKNNIDGLGDVEIADGKIVAVNISGTPIIGGGGGQTIDCTGKVICPGLIDIHVHLRVPGQEYKEDITSGLGSAVAGGFTAVACMPNTKPVIDIAPIVRDLYAQAEKAKLARLYVIGAISKDLENKELSEMADLKDAGTVAVSDDAFQVQEASFMRKAMEYAAMLGLPVLAHCEDTNLSDGGTMNEGYISSVLGLKGLPREAYEMDVVRNCLLAQRTGAHLHVLHVSTRREVGLIRFFKSEGVKVTAETGPHYWCLTDEMCKGYNTNAKMNPPLREKADCDAIIVGLQDGTLDAIATDHAPHAQYEKDQEFALAPFGIHGLETSLALGITHLVKLGHLTMSQLVSAMSTAPARILGLPGGNLSVGSVADVTVFDPDLEWIVEPEKFVSKGKNTPFGGEKLVGKTVYTVVGGQLVYG